MTRRCPLRRSIARSSANHAVPVAFTRMKTSPPSVGRTDSTAARAESLSAGATASSRSRITVSARSTALAKRSGRSPGQKSRAGPSAGGSPYETMCPPPSGVGRGAAHHRRALGHRDDHAVLVAGGVLEHDDPDLRP